MTRAVYKSKCCNAEVRTDGVPDFIGSKEVCTISFVCLRCDKLCDVSENIVVEKSKMLKVNINEDIEVRLTREGMRIYRAYWKKYHLRPLPLKKSSGCWVRFHLWDFMHIFGNAMYMGAPAIIVGNIIRIPKS